MMLLPLSSTLLVRLVAAVLVLVLAVRVARARLRLLALVVLGMGMLWGYGDYRRVGSLDAAARQIAAQVQLGASDPDTAMPQLLVKAHVALVEAGLDPNMLRVTVQCVHGQTSLVLSETHAQGLLGLWGRSNVRRVLLWPPVACGGAP
jgi:hypothetical protein